MIAFIKKLYRNQMIRYIFFGGCTTMVNLVSYGILRAWLKVDILKSSFLSIILSILFAYVVNKLFVFESKKASIRELLKEFVSFVGMRMITMFVETFGTLFLSCVWNIPDMGAKLAMNVVVLVLNFVFSKLVVFNEKECCGYMTEKVRKARIRKKRCVAISFAIPALTMLVAYIINGVWPFSDHGVLIIDSLHQYLPFFTDFHQKLADSETLLYSFGGGLGYNMWAAIAYYLASPLNFLITLVSMEHVMDFMAYLIILKISLSGAFFAWYLAERGEGRDYSPIPFACMFALSNFMIGYYFNIMWLDSVMVLPLVMKGIERITQGKSGKLFALSLFYGLYCNYYIGYMLCLFSCLYFLAQWVEARKFQVRKFILSGLRFAWYALLSGGMAAIMLVPAYMNLGITESANNSFPTKVKFYTSTLAQLTGHFALTEPINIYDDQSGVNIYCGVIILILVILYILDRELKFKERLSKVVLAGMFLLSMNFNMLNYIWHGFHVQNGLPNRFAFLYIGILLVMGFDSLRHIRSQQPWRVLLSWIIPVAFAAVSLQQNIGEREWYVYVVTLALLGIYGILLLALCCLKQWYRKLKPALLVLMALETAVMGVYGVCMNGTVGRSTYVDEQKAYQAMMPRQEGNHEFFRSDIDSQRMRNENMFMGANGLVMFSSTMPAATVNLCRSIGMEARTNKNGYNGVTKMFNDVFGIRYVVSKNALSDTLYQMEKVDYEEPLNLFYNKDALSLGFMVSSNIKNWDIHDKVPMKVQDDFAELATGVPFFYTLREAYSLEEGPTYIIRLHPGEQTYIEFTENVKKLVIKTPQYEKTINNYTKNVFNLGTVTEEGEASKVNITITYKDNSMEPVPVRVYTCTDEEYREVYDRLAANQMENVEESGNRVTGSIHVDQAGTLLLTVPYDKGWKVEVDGQERETYAVGEALTGVDLETGDHEIEMVFTPQGLWMGSILSIVSILLFMVSCYVDARIRKKSEKKPCAERKNDGSGVI